MIKGITGGQYIQVNNGTPGSTYVNNYSGAQGIGNMRFNTSTQNIEVYDGNNWVMLASNYAEVKLTWDAENLLNYVKTLQGIDIVQKIANLEARDKKRKELIAQHPQLAKAYEAIKRAEENFEIFAKFVENDSNTRESESVQSGP